jgi:2-polyprenyl-6-methoxyphenol hydroxylase-like FAD-dependent oxidoreductase
VRGDLTDVGGAREVDAGVMTDPHAIVVGAGIAGLTSAIALEHAGWRVTVTERAEALEPAGAGISLWPNAVRALASLGLGDRVDALSARASGTAMHRWDGRPLGGSVADLLEDRFGAPLRVIHRADLQALLLEALDQPVRCGRPCSAVEDDGDVVLVRSAGTAPLRADLVVGADGIRSAVRTAVGDGAQARPAGYTAWRGVVRLPPGAVERTGEFLGRGRLFGIAELPEDRVYWWASVRGSVPDSHDPEALAGLFRGWARPIEDLIRATPAEQRIETPLEHRAPADRMAHGRVVLVGDAAHPMLPNIGQGGCQAIEDAVVLGAVLRGTRDVPEALVRFDALRREHVLRVVRTSRQMARVVHLSNPLAVAVRDAALRGVSADASARRLAPIVGHDAAQTA